MILPAITPTLMKALSHVRLTKIDRKNPPSIDGSLKSS